MKKIKLTKGFFTVVNDEDYLDFSNWNWHTVGKNKYYAARSEKKGGVNKKIYLHREICKPLREQDVDHANGNTLDNRRSNLRSCSRSENLGNKKIPINNTSGYKGVWWDKGMKKWRVSIVRKTVGFYVDKLMAAKAYNEAALNYYGKFAKLNYV